MDRTIKKPRFFSLPAVGRRSFLKIGVGAYASLLSGCMSRQNGAGSVSTRSFLLKGERDWVSSVCRLCPSACAVRAYLEAGKIVAVGGDPDDPNTGGKMCPIGLSVLNLHTNPDRLTGAFRRNPDGRLVPARAEESLSLIASRIRGGGVLHIHGRITPFASQLAKTLDAACHLDPVSEGASGFPRFLNTDGRPPVLDFDEARIVLSFDSNILEHGYPFVGYVRRITEARLRGLKLVTLSPFLTNTATAGDWIPMRSRSSAPLASLAVARQALEDSSLHLPALPREIADSLRSLDGTSLENASGLSHEAVQEICRRFFSEPGPAISDLPDPSVLLLNLMKGNLNRRGGLRHPGQQRLRVEADFGEISGMLQDRNNVVLLNQSNPAFSLSSEVRPILRSSDRALVVCIDSFMSETAELSDFVLPLASPLETLTVAEPLPLGQPFLAAALPAVKPGSSCRSFDEWLTLLAAAINGSAPPLTPERFAAQAVLGDMSAKLAADRAIYAVESESKQLEADMPALISALRTLISRVPQVPESRVPFEPEQYLLTTFEESVQGPVTAPSKWLNEITYSPKVYLHPQRARRLGVGNGDRVILTGGNGASVEGIASLFEGVHPEALAVPLHHGHTGYGRVARGEAFTDGQDSDMSRIFWGKNRGINPAELPEGIITIRKRRG